MKQPVTGRRGGFTVLEITIVAALAALLVALLYTPMANGLMMANRENTLMNMFRTGDMLVSRIASELEPAIIPVPVEGGSGLTGKQSSYFRQIVNSNDRGFGRFGRRWRDILRAGTDMVPFCVPVRYINTEAMVDADGLPVLGAVGNNGQPAPGSVYFENVVDGVRTFSLYHPATGIAANINSMLAQLDPADWGLADPRPAMTSLDEIRFDDLVTFPAGTAFPLQPSWTGAALLRFNPRRENGDPEGAPVVLSEADLNQDLNQDGATDDTFARGEIIVEYSNNILYSESLAGAEAYRRWLQKHFPVGTNSVLLQLNTRDEGFVPIFQLVDGSAPSSENWGGEAVSSGSAAAIHVRLLLFDEETQRGTPLATGPNPGRGFITRQFQTTIELRNMALE